MGAPDELILGCAVTVTTLIEMTTWTTTSRPLSQRPLPRGQLQAADQSMDAFLEFITSDTLKPAPNTATNNHAACGDQDASSTLCVLQLKLIS